MLKMEIVVHDQLWPQLVITVTRESFSQGRVVLQQRQQYDLAYGKAEEMVHNGLRPMIEELVKRHSRTANAQPQQP